MKEYRGLLYQKVRSCFRGTWQYVCSFMPGPYLSPPSTSLSMLKPTPEWLWTWRVDLSYGKMTYRWKGDHESDTHTRGSPCEYPGRRHGEAADISPLDISGLDSELRTERRSSFLRHLVEAAGIPRRQVHHPHCCLPKAQAP